MARVEAQAGNAVALELAAHALNHPASTQGAGGHAERLRGELVAQRAPQEVEEAQARAQGLTLEALLAEILAEAVPT